MIRQPTRTLKYYTVHEGGGMYVVKAHSIAEVKRDAGYSSYSQRVRVTHSTDAEIAYYGKDKIEEAQP